MTPRRAIHIYRADGRSLCGHSIHEGLTAEPPTCSSCLRFAGKRPWMDAPAKESLTARIDAAVFEQLDQRAKGEGRSRSAVVEAALRNYLEVGQ